MDYNVIATNLDRRPDKWQLFYDTLIGQGVPSEHIVRFSAHDGALYENTEDAMSDAASRYHPVPPFLRLGGRQATSEWCWRWSWYEALEQIALSDVPMLFLIDDIKLLCDYEEVCQHLEVLDSIHNNGFLLVQYGGGHKGNPQAIFTKPVAQLPIFQHGLGGSWDRSTLYSPSAARWFLNFVNGLPTPERISVYPRLAIPHQRPGMFSRSINRHAEGMWTEVLPTDRISDREPMP